MRQWMSLGPIGSVSQKIGRAALAAVLISSALFAPSGFAQAPSPDSEFTTFIYPKECILRIVASKMNVELDPRIIPPRVRLESEVSLKEFQDAVEPWWNIRPNSVANVYTPLSDEIFLTDRKASYRRGRVIDDSMAHEYAHFIQVRYRNADINQGGDQWEIEAVDVQTWFRQNFILTPQNVYEICGFEEART